MGTRAPPSSPESSRPASESMDVSNTRTRSFDKSASRASSKSSSPINTSGPLSSSTAGRADSHDAVHGSSSGTRTSPSSCENLEMEDVVQKPRDKLPSSSSSSGDDVDLSLYYSKPLGENQIAYLNGIARKYVRRGAKNKHAVVIFTFVHVGEKWRTSDEHPAIIIPSHLLPPNPPVYVLGREGYDHDFVNDTLMYLANEIEELEGVAPFVSCIDFGHYEIGHEVDYVVSLHAHDALLYLYDCKLQPSRVAFAPSVPVAARYHHRSRCGSGNTFETRLYVERRNEEAIRTFTRQYMQGDHDPTVVPHSPVFEEDTLETITSRLGRKLKKNLDDKLKVYADLQNGEGTQGRPVIFTNDIDLWILDRDPVIVVNEPLPPIRQRRFYYDNELIANHVLEYLVKTARLEMNLDINVHYLRFENRRIEYEVHLILMKQFVTFSDFLYGDVEPRPRLPHNARIALVQCNTGIPLSPYVRTFVSVKWVERRNWAKWAHDSEAENQLEFDDDEYAGASENIVTRLSAELRAELANQIQIFIEMRCQKGRGVTVIFTADSELWRKEENSKIEFRAALSRDHGVAWDTVPEITDYILQLAELRKVNSLNVACLWLECSKGMHAHLVLSQRDQPALAYLEEFERKSEPDAADSFAATKVSDGIYRYRSPVDGGCAPKMYVRVTRRVRIAAYQVAEASEVLSREISALTVSRV